MASFSISCYYNRLIQEPMSNCTLQNHQNIRKTTVNNQNIHLSCKICFRHISCRKKKTQSNLRFDIIVKVWTEVFLGLIEFVTAGISDDFLFQSLYVNFVNQALFYSLCTWLAVLRISCRRHSHLTNLLTLKLYINTSEH